MLSDGCCLGCWCFMKQTFHWVCGHETMPRTFCWNISSNFGLAPGGWSKSYARSQSKVQSAGDTGDWPAQWTVFTWSHSSILLRSKSCTKNSMLCQLKCDCTIAEIIVLLLHKDFVFHATFTTVPMHWTASANSLASHLCLSTQGDLRLFLSLSPSSAPFLAPTVTITCHTTLTFDSLHHASWSSTARQALFTSASTHLPLAKDSCPGPMGSRDWLGGARVRMKQTWWCSQPKSLQEVNERNTSHLCFYTQKNICY